MSLGPGPQYHPPELIFWNLLGSPAEVTWSAAGPNCTLLGAPTYGAGPNWPDFGNSVLINQNGEAVTAPNPVGGGFNLNGAGCWEVWEKPSGWNVVNGASSDGLIHTMWSADNGANQMTCAHQAGRLQLYYWNAVLGFLIFYTWLIPGMNALSGEWHHFALVWDATGIDGTGDTSRVYWDGVDLNSLAAAIPGSMTNPAGDSFRIGLNDWAGAHFYNGYLDNFKHWDYAKTDFSDRFTEGFAPAAVVTPRAAEPPALRSPAIDIDGIDLSCRLDGLPKIHEESTQSSDLPFSATAEIRLSNSDEAFSLESPHSVFAPGRWQGRRVRLWDRWGVEVFDGQMESLNVDDGSRTATVTARNALYRWRDERVSYTSAADETPGECLLAIFAALGFTDYDEGTLAASIAAQQAAGMAFRTTLVDADGATLASVLAALSIYGVADVWEHLGRIHYRHFTTREARLSLELAECHVLGNVKRYRRTESLVNDYSIGYTGPNNVTDATAGNIGADSRTINGPRALKDVDSTVNAQYEVRNLATATYIGEQWIRWTNADLATNPRPPLEIELPLRPDTPLLIGDDFTLTFPREGWTDKVFRVTKFDRDDERNIKILTAVEWGS